MVKFFSLLIVFGIHTCLGQDNPEKLQLAVTTGYRQDNLRWSIAGNANGQNPNVLSELRWQSVAGPVTGVQLKYRSYNHWQLEGEYEHTFFLSGKVTDTDYGGNDRTNSVYAQQFNAAKGGADRWLAGFAYHLSVTNKFSITPSAGYGLFHQALYLVGNTAPLNELNSSYKTTWSGPYCQVLCATGLTKRLSITTGFRYNQVRYRASANWNLIREFRHPESFRHTANGYGINIHTGLLFRAAQKHSIGITGSYSRWQTGRGIDELYLANGEPEQTQLNEVRSFNWQVMAEWRIALIP
jgi:hypothetical protein